LNNVDLNRYKDFVKEVTSNESLSSMQMYNRMIDIEATSGGKLNMASLMTGAIGLSSEGGEFAEIVKKCIFQGKPMDDETVFHCKRELGDIMWYWITSCRALGLDPNEVVEENVNKLKSRYPGGEFDVHYSENRKEGDL
jgi:NTP pyrophosphatase (non-canonical NTP hydrolase)